MLLSAPTKRARYCPSYRNVIALPESSATTETFPSIPRCTVSIRPALSMMALSNPCWSKLTLLPLLSWNIQFPSGSFFSANVGVSTGRQTPERSVNRCRFPLGILTSATLVSPTWVNERLQDSEVARPTPRISPSCNASLAERLLYVQLNSSGDDGCAYSTFTSNLLPFPTLTGSPKQLSLHSGTPFPTSLFDSES